MRLLEEALSTGIVAPIENFPFDLDPTFQQDGLPPHFHVPLSNHLGEEFRGRWSGRKDNFKWPLRSPDFAPLDVFLGGYIKERVF